MNKDKIKYNTEEERLQARKESAKKYYEKNKKLFKEKQNIKYQKEKDIILNENKNMRAIYKLYKEEKLIEKQN
jgi:hypothetical protein